MPRLALLPLILGRPDAILECDTTVAPQGAEDMDRREFSVLAAGLAAAATLPMPARVDRAHVRYLRATLDQLRTQDNVAGGGAVLPRALRLFEHARQMLDESDYSPAVGRELLVVTADLGIKTAWSAFDANDQPLARRLNEKTALLADSAGDGAQRAYLYANMMQQSTCMARHTGKKGYAREALRFVDRATDAARHEPSPALHALISMRQSLAHAQLDDEVAFRSAITTARRELDRGPHDADSIRTKWFTHSEITGYEAAGRAQLGAPDQAVQLYHAVLDDTARSPRDQAFYRSRLAGTLVTTGDLDQAISHGLAILPDLGTTLTSGRVLRNLRPLRSAATGPTGAEFRDQFDAAAHALRAT